MRARLGAGLMLVTAVAITTDEYFEMLCDIGSAELLMPSPWFPADAARVTTAAELLRQHILYLVAEEGYLRPPDDEPQDFGYEKEMMEFVNSAGRE